MIEKLDKKNIVDLVDFFNRVKDSFEDFFITVGRERKFFKGNWLLIEKVLQKYQCYGLFKDCNLKGLMIIIKDRDFPRSYVKLLAENSKYTIDLLKFLKWNYFEKDLYWKLKKENLLVTMISKTGFYRIGDRGRELLFFKKGLKQLYPLISKDSYLKNEEHKLY